jgi:hypothetical protein
MNTPLQTVLRTAVEPALDLLPVKMKSNAARVILLAITLQEADAVNRVQFGNGPAHGLWQFERGGGVKGVMEHPSSRDFARALCQARKVPFDRVAVWEALVHDDVLAAGLARLLLYTDFHPLPGVDASVEETWGYYERNWRPGKPRPADWPKNLAAARELVLGKDA